MKTSENSTIDDKWIYTKKFSSDSFSVELDDALKNGNFDNRFGYTTSKQLDWSNRSFDFLVGTALQDYLKCLDVNVVRFNEEIKCRWSYWINKYGTGANQETHSHFESNPLCKRIVTMSFSYMYRIPTDGLGSQLIFVENPPAHLLSSVRYEYMTEEVKRKTKEMEQRHFQQDELVMWPSELNHQVTVNKSEQTRITISGNIYMEKK